MKKETKGKYLEKDFVVLENVQQCSICRGTVDKYPYTLKCRDCGAFGDLFMGMMTDLSRKELKDE